jgi:8-oxo-dGTP diphosphatase
MTKMNYVVGFVFDEDLAQVLLIEKLKPEYLKGLLNGIGGKIEPGELAKYAMSREFEEEAGVPSRPDDWRMFLHLNSSNNMDNFDLFGFLAFNNELFYEAKTMEAEIIGRYDVDDLPTHVVPNLRWIIPLALDNRRIERMATVQDIAYINQTSSLKF